MNGIIVNRKSFYAESLCIAGQDNIGWAQGIELLKDFLFQIKLLKDSFHYHQSSL